MGKDNEAERSLWAGLVAALLSEPSLAAAAERAGISDNRARRLMQNPKFLRVLRRARRAVVEAAVGRLQQAASQAVDTLVRNLGVGTPNSQNAAAKAILDIAVRAVELSDVMEELDKLKQVVRELSDAKHAGEKPDREADGRGEEAEGGEEA